jgi:hypothetical protein
MVLCFSGHRCLSPLCDRVATGEKETIIFWKEEKMKKVNLVSILVFMLFLIASFGSFCRAAPIQWSGNGHFYEAIEVSEGITWTDAKTAAELAGGYLTTITSPEENEFVFNLIDDERFWIDNATGPWLGGYQPPGSPEPDGNWQWVTGEPFNYTHWRLYEPSNTGGNENCLHFSEQFGTYGIRSSFWNDLAGDLYYLKGYVIEVPEPATILLLTLGLVGLRRKL